MNYVLIHYTHYYIIIHIIIITFILLITTRISVKKFDFIDVLVINVEWYFKKKLKPNDLMEFM